MPHSFCRLLSNGYSFRVNRNGNLTVSPCCLFKGEILVDHNLSLARKEVFESISDWTGNCAQCHQLEQSNQPSLRLTGPDWISDDVSPQSAIMVDINLDQECNAACVICNEKSSTLWRKENNKFQGVKIRVEKTTDSVDQQIQKIISMVPLDEMTYVKFFGGEPLFTDTHLKLLRQLPNPQNVTVHYTTNGSILPNQSVLDLWSKFKTVIFAASLDGVNEQFDYVRWPLSWKKVSRNLVRLQQYKLHNLMFRVEFTANLLNVFYYDKLENWVRKNWHSNLFGDETEINIHSASHSAFNLSDMPASLRLRIQEKYPSTHRLHLMVKNLQNVPDLTKFTAFVDRWDPVRGISWQSCFPDLISDICSK